MKLKKCKPISEKGKWAEKKRKKSGPLPNREGGSEGGFGQRPDCFFTGPLPLDWPWAILQTQRTKYSQTSPEGALLVLSSFVSTKKFFPSTLYWIK